MDVPLPQTWWVEPGRLLAGGYPGDVNHARTKDNLRRLLQAGIRCFISLQETGEMSWTGRFEYYAPEVEALARELQAGPVAWHQFSIPDMGVTDTMTMTTILNTMRMSIAQGDCVYVHCWGGHGRTGTVIGCWLREQGLCGLDALKRLQELRAHDEVLLEWDCPQTQAQVNMILEWEPGNGSRGDKAPHA